MVRSYAMRVLLGAAFLAAVPTAAIAQSEPPILEGSTWYLVSYDAGGELIQVPWHVDASLTFQDGAALGSAGCNGLAGSYVLDGDTLTFDSVGTSSDIGCSDAWMDVEYGYLAALPTTANWARDTGPSDTGLNLYNDAGNIVLTFQKSAATLTRADVFALASELDALQDRIVKLERQATRN